MNVQPFQMNFICMKFFLRGDILHSVNSTPEVITEYDEKYSEVIELIMEKNKVDIENRGF